MTTIKIVNAETGEEIERDMNSKELKQWEADAAASAAKEQSDAAKAALKQDLLNRLGITEEEAALLLG